ncbi:MAG: cation/H(+) antiporter [Pedosphaera sp.]|nr:cation/H(+) antiporter [Pedosphaera sp.]
MRRNVLLYFLITLGFGLGMYYTIQAGKRLEIAKTPPPVAIAQPSVAEPPSVPLSNSGTGLSHVLQGLRDNLQEPLSQLLVQLLLIVLLARIFGSLFAKMGQPAVIGEMLAGIVLGPSVIGGLFPDAYQFLFPVGSLQPLRMLSQVGVIVFMFVVGMELDVKHLRHKASTAVMVSHVSIFFPYLLGVVFSYFIYQSYAAQNVSFTGFALFMGTAMSITAFPVLARILEERNLTKTHLGSTAITCAAVDDVSAWTILAFVVAIAKAGSPGGSILTIFLLLAFVAITLLWVKPFLYRLLGANSQDTPPPTRNSIIGILLLVFAAGLITEIIGIHALFGAFLVGVIMPPDTRFRTQLRLRLESFSSSFLLPLFFAVTGLRTHIELLNDWSGVAVCLGLIFVATLGKLGGSMFAARWTGMDWHDSFALGALMNTRGLVELIVLNIGYELGILSPRIFTMMVIMALVTTAMTGPLLSLGNFLRRKSPVLVAESTVA